MNLKLIEVDLSLFNTTKMRHDFYSELVQVFKGKFEVLGLIKYNRNKASDSEVDDFFENSHLKGSQETQILTIEQLISNLEKKGALVEGIELVFYDLKNKHLFTLGMLAKTDKRKLEVGLIGDTKIVEYDSLDKIKSKADIIKYESMGLTESQKQEIALNMWNIISEEFYKYRKNIIEKNASS